MSFTGDLNHLPIVDVLQLLHATKKSGTLTVKGRRGECILVLADGYLIGGKHARQDVHLGRILVDLNLLGPEVGDQVVAEQQRGGQPLAALLLEGKHVKQESVIRGLETLIEMAIVEILTWPGGTFTLEVDRVELFDDYRYFQQQGQEIVFSTQNVLMDALRIYDEKRRDGELLVEVDGTEDAGAEEEAAAEPAAAWTLSADDLGLADLDRLEKKIPGVFSSLPDINPLDLHRQKLGEVAAGLAPEEQEKLLAFLQQLTERIVADKGSEGGRGRVILFSPDELLQYMLTAACKDSGVFIFASDDEQDLVPIIEQSIGKDNGTLLVLDRPAPPAPAFSDENLAHLRRKLRAEYPRLPLIQLAPPSRFPFIMQAFDDGIRTVFPRPQQADDPAVFVANFCQFISVFRKHLQGFARAQGEKSIGRLSRCLTGMRALREAPETAFAILRFVATLFPRAMTLVVGPTELLGEKAFGVTGDGAESRLHLRIPLAKGSLFARTIEEGRLFHGPAEDPLLQEHLYKAIGAPRHSLCLLLPLQSRGRTVALIYADFAGREVAQVQTELLEILAGQGSLLLEMAGLRKKLENGNR